MFSPAAFRLEPERLGAIKLMKRGDGTILLVLFVSCGLRLERMSISFCFNMLARLKHCKCDLLYREGRKVAEEIRSRSIIDAIGTNIKYSCHFESIYVIESSLTLIVIKTLLYIKSLEGVSSALSFHLILKNI